ncbi:hypothetical protein BDV36DRAFT_247682 [Aspergillus pseudocaelatus]|uniref:Uncharacterized protein n=1 Tax=Aspergillus pseudocaelatus TaxID=1825620 RepID=A0ABQ6WWU6_9EURO|nr:hypothetical protein BDV36DRAFT_247682 [Aspergillus pseudocaelatus]
MGQSLMPQEPGIYIPTVGQQRHQYRVVIERNNRDENLRLFQNAAVYIHHTVLGGYLYLRLCIVLRIGHNTMIC